MFRLWLSCVVIVTVPAATFDDGSCIQALMGCNDPDAINYNPLATVDDGSCLEVIRGCTNETAFNYNIDANIDDGTCGVNVTGCTDPRSYTFSPAATWPLRGTEQLPGLCKYGKCYCEPGASGVDCVGFRPTPSFLAGGALPGVGKATAAKLVAQMNKDQKCALLNGVGWDGYNTKDGYYIGNTQRVGPLADGSTIPSINMQDAAQGFRTSDARMYGTVTSWPCRASKIALACPAVP